MTNDTRPTFREATDADRPAIHRMAQAFIRGSIFGRVSRYVPAQLDLLISFVFDKGVCFLAEVAGTPVGMIAIVALPDVMAGGQVNANEIVWWVDEAHRTGSIGPRLLALAESWAVNAGCNVLKMVAPYGSVVGGYLERRGYTPLELHFVRSLSDHGIRRKRHSDGDVQLSGATAPEERTAGTEGAGGDDLREDASRRAGEDGTGAD